jgi:hypothetical protein
MRTTDAVSVPGLDGLDRSLTDEPIVLLRLCLMAADEPGGEERMVSSLVRPLSMPIALVGPDVQIAIELRGEPHVFTPSAVIWDEAHRACIVEVAWQLPDGDGVADVMGESGTWPA